ncbi:MAG: hypothetical protein WC813_02055 [Patescibacteria group bacterium]|jgi:hypothetical protein
MTMGLLAAVVMLVTFLMEETVFVVLPLPWRLIPPSLVLALALMHRVSFELGALFFLASTSAMILSGLAPVGLLVVAFICVFTAYGLSTHVFARRSLAAFGGLALVTGSVYFLLRFGVVARVHGFFPWMGLFLAAMTALLAVVASLVLERTMSGFGKRFVTKSETYEVRGER